MVVWASTEHQVCLSPPVLGPQKPLFNLAHKSQVAEGCLTSQSAQSERNIPWDHTALESRGEKNKPFSGCLPEREICSPTAFKAIASPPVFLYSGYMSSPIHTEEDMEVFGLSKGGRGEPGKSEGNKRKFKSTLDWRRQKSARALSGWNRQVGTCPET